MREQIWTPLRVRLGGIWEEAGGTQVDDRVGQEGSPVERR